MLALGGLMKVPAMQLPIIFLLTNPVRSVSFYMAYFTGPVCVCKALNDPYIFSCHPERQSVSISRDFFVTSPSIVSGTPALEHEPYGLYACPPGYCDCNGLMSDGNTIIRQPKQYSICMHWMCFVSLSQRYKHEMPWAGFPGSSLRKAGLPHLEGPKLEPL